MSGHSKNTAFSLLVPCHPFSSYFAVLVSACYLSFWDKSWKSVVGVVGVLFVVDLVGLIGVVGMMMLVGVLGSVELVGKVVVVGVVGVVRMFVGVVVLVVCVVDGDICLV